MTDQPKDASWAELGREWRARTTPAIDEAALRKRLQRQRWMQRVNVFFEAVVAVLAFGGCFVLMRKHISLGAVSFIFVAITVSLGLWARSGKERGDLASVSGMIELSISRAERSLRYVAMTFLICIVSLLFIAYVIVHMSFTTVPPSPQREHGQWAIAATLVYVAAFLLGALIYQWRTQRVLARFRKLRAELQGEAGDGG
jgi:hypothetical protein